MCERTALCWTLVLLGSCASSQALPTPKEASSTLDAETIPLCVFVPTSYDAARPPPALVLLHGARGTGQWMVAVWQQFAQEHGVLLVAPTLAYTPAQELRINLLLSRLLAAVQAKWSIDPRRVYVFGYSAGGYLAYDAAAMASSSVAAVGVFGAVIAKEYEWIVQAPGQRAPVAMYLGTDDRSLTLEDGVRTRDLLERSGFTVRYVTLPGLGHDYLSAAPWVNADVWAFFEEHPLEP